MSRKQRGAMSSDADRWVRDMEWDEFEAQTEYSQQ